MTHRVHRALAPSQDLEVARRFVESAADGEPGTRDRIISFWDDAILERRSRHAHVTGSAAVVDAAGERMLVLLHTKVGRWLQPGGHADGDANLAAVALREATEETGIEGLQVVVPAIDLDVHEFVAPGEEIHLHLDVRFLVLAPPGAVPVGNAESRAIRWATPRELADLDVDRGIRRLAHRALDLAFRLRGDW